MQDKIAQSGLKAEVETAKAELKEGVSRLESKLAESVPKASIDRLRAKIGELARKRHSPNVRPANPNII